MLKRLAIHATRSFEAEVRKGTREGLTEDEKTETAVPEEEGKTTGKGDTDDKSKKGKKKAERNTGVKQAKIIRQQDRVDPVTGKGRSRGYGFLELHAHADALRVLRWANNNPSIGPLFEEWWRSELEDLIKAEEKKKEEDSTTKVKRMKDQLEAGGKKAKGELIVEFSIENVQVVQRRAAHQREKPTVRFTPISLFYQEIMSFG